MKTLNQYIQEKLIVNKDYRDAGLSPKSFDELRKIIEDRYDKLGPGTKHDPIDFNDIDVSNIDSFYNRNIDKGIFSRTDFKYIDISYWDVSNVTDMSYMFFACEELKSVGDLSNWDVSNVMSTHSVFSYCIKLKSFGDISGWDVSNVNDMSNMFNNCKKFNQNISGWNVSKVTDMSNMFECCKFFNQNLSGWDVSNVNDMSNMFNNCKKFNQDISNWNVSKVMFKYRMFYNCAIKEKYKPKFK